MAASNREVLHDKTQPAHVRRTLEYQAVLRFADRLDSVEGNWIEPDFQAFAMYLAKRKPDKSGLSYTSMPFRNVMQVSNKRKQQTY